MSTLKAFSVAVALTLSNSVSATIMSVDWETAGDNLITRDTTSGLDWLDVSYTSGVSYNAFQSNVSSGGELTGFRVATFSEIDSLLASANVIQNNSTTGHQDMDNAAEVEALVDLLGCTSSCISPYEPINDWNKYYAVSGVTDSLAIQVISVDLLTGNTLTRRDQIVWADYDFSGVGLYLVRDAAVVPIPAAFWLFGSGLIGMVGMARRKKVV